MSSGVPIWTLSYDPANTTPESRSVIVEHLAASEPHTQGWLVLRTCRRVVILGAGPRPGPGALIATVGPEAAGESLGRDGSSAIEHVLRLAAGLESAVIGEDQILSQIRALRRSADAAVIVDGRLVRLLDTAISVGRRARADRPRDERSLAERGLAWLQERSGPVGGARMLVAGVGPIGREIARLAATAGAHVRVASRDPAAHAQAHGPGGPGTPISLAEAVSLVPKLDLLAVALAGPWLELVAVESPLPVAVDLSAPPAVPAAVRARSGSRLATLEELVGSRVAPSETTAAYVAHAEQLARAAAAALCTELGGTDHIAVLRAIRADAEARRATDVDRLYRRLPELDDRQRALIEQASRQLVAGLLHEPTKRLRDSPSDARVALARDLFGVGQR